MWVLRIKLGSPCLQDNCFNDQAVFLASPWWALCVLHLCSFLWQWLVGKAFLGGRRTTGWEVSCLGQSSLVSDILRWSSVASLGDLASQMLRTVYPLSLSLDFSAAPLSWPDCPSALPPHGLYWDSRVNSSDSNLWQASLRPASSILRLQSILAVICEFKPFWVSFIF